MDFAKAPAYRLIKEEYIPELQSMSYLAEHKKTKARVFLMENDDENKVFTIGFRTPVMNSTGVPHIIEHTVLCGSEKYPAKDPFVELVKGSMNTFLNAMTYPDKTLYPVASCNDKDFKNLMDVYLDAVFHPNIYRNRMIFEQEGWHYELEFPEAPLTINGVVYNEMKGAYSAPDSILDSEVMRLLYPDTTYGQEPGGAPECIPDLSYEEFLDFHRKYYHPSNSYIYLYGNMDMEERLAYLDQVCLSHYDYLEVDSKVGLQESFEEARRENIFYPVTEEEKVEDAAYLSWNVVTGTDLDPEKYVGFQILEYALLSAPGAPLKQAVLDAGIGRDVYGGYENGIYQPYFNVTAKDARPEQRDAFEAVIEKTLAELADKGLNKKSLRAAMNYFEFKYREADFGNFPKGLMYGLQCCDSWLYDEDPVMHLKYEDTFESLKKKMEQGYFEDLIRSCLVGNTHKAVVAAVPKRGLLKEQEEALALKLADYKAELKPEELEALAEHTKALKKYQEEPSSREDLEKIPILTREDIKKEAEPLKTRELTLGKTKLLFHEYYTSGIGYLRLMFDTKELTEEELPYLGLLKAVLGYVNTKNYSYQDLFDEINIHSGGINAGTSVYSSVEDADIYRGTFEIHMKALFEKFSKVFELTEEIINTSSLEDDKRLFEIVSQLKSRGQARLLQSGHQAAVLRASSYQSASAYYSEATGGIEFYHFIEDFADHFEEKKEKVKGELRRIMDALFDPLNLTVSLTADQEGLAALESVLPGFAEKLRGKIRGENRAPHINVKKNEGFKCSSQVQYVARTGNFKKAGLPYTGVLRILKVILNYDYLWIRLRVQGGAYGCMSGFARNGESYFVSYRDPGLKASNRVYEAMPEYLEKFEADEREMTKYIIGTVSDLDVPLTPSAKGARSLGAYMSQITDEMVQRDRDQVLSADVSDIRKLAEYARAVLESGCICVVGNDARIEEDKELFEETVSLFH